MNIAILISSLVLAGVLGASQAPKIDVKTVVEAQTTPTPKPITDVEYIMTKKHVDMLLVVYALESNWGKNDGCKNRGYGYNGYGYGQSTYAWNCFDTFEEVTDKVDKWFEVQLKTKTIPQALCYYNTGHVVSDCIYYQKYLSLTK